MEHTAEWGGLGHLSEGWWTEAESVIATSSRRAPSGFYSATLGLGGVGLAYLESAAAAAGKASVPLPHTSEIPIPAEPSSAVRRPLTAPRRPLSVHASMMHEDASAVQRIARGAARWRGLLRAKLRRAAT